jgi:hypothetical protein
MHGRDEKCVQYFGCKPEGKRPLGRPRCRWEDIIIMYLQEMGWEFVDWIHLAQNWDQLRAEHYNEQWISIKARNLLTS